MRRKVLKGKRLGRKTTTTNRRSRKTSTTFCVFHLTGNIPKLILRIQIRGTWKRQTDRVGDMPWSGFAPRSSPVSPQKTSAKYLLRAVVGKRGVCCSAVGTSPALGSAFVFFDDLGGMPSRRTTNRVAFPRRERNPLLAGGVKYKGSPARTTGTRCGEESGWLR